MQTVPLASNPFAMMLDLQSVIDAMDRSEHLALLQRQIFRPLDKPLISTLPDLQAFDEAIDFAPEPEEWTNLWNSL